MSGTGRTAGEPDKPAFLEPISTDEYDAPPRTAVQREASARAADRADHAVGRTGTTPRRYWSSRTGTAAGLLALNEASSARFYEVPDDAAIDEDAAEETFASDGPVVDVQTHWIADRPELRAFQEHILRAYRYQAPDWWTGLDGVTAFTMAEYLRCIFVESETAVAVISSTPGNGDQDMLLTNREMAGMRELFDRMTGTGRLLNHTVVRPNAGELDRMPEWAAEYRPSAWKVYTMGLLDAAAVNYVPGSGWRLDDERTGIPFLERVRETGVTRICAHKGVSGLVPTASPSDVGPAATAFPDIDFLIYHSGYEPGQPEGPFGDDTADQGVNRLIESVRASGLGHGSNVYAELGTTWFNVVSRPLEAAHVLGKLLLHLGEDNVIWGTDAIWYGPTQPVLDAFRAFQIPDALCEEFGYPKLTPAARRKILFDNAARVYGIDGDAVRASVDDDVLGWAKAVADEVARAGLVA